MHAELKSIIPVPLEDGMYLFQVEVEIGKESKTIPTTISAEDVLDVGQLQAIVASHTGCLLRVPEEGVEAFFARAWKDPAPVTQGPDITAFLDENLTIEEEVKDLPK